MSESPNPRWVLQNALSLYHQLEYLISAARAVTEDDKLSPETRLVMVAVRLAEIDRHNDAVDAALLNAAAALREAEPA